MSALATSVLAWCAVVAMPIRAQEEGLRRADPFEESIEIQVVNLEVVVTNEEDEQITGLGRDDFVVRVDGVKVPLRYFSEAGVEEEAGPGQNHAVGSEATEGTS